MKRVAEWGTHSEYYRFGSEGVGELLALPMLVYMGFGYCVRLGFVISQNIYPQHCGGGEHSLSFDSDTFCSIFVFCCVFKTVVLW